MTALLPYQYVVLRCVPRVEREEFLNVGVVLYCQARDLLEVAWRVDEDRVRHAFPDLDVTRLIRFHDASGAEATIALHTVEDPSRYGVVVTDVAGQVEAFIEKPPADEAPSKAINAGTYVFEPSVLGRIAVGRKVSVERETFPAIAADGRLYALEGNAYWLDAGTPETYLQANLDLLPPDASSVHPEAFLAGSAHVERSIVGSGASIGEDATLTEAVVLPDATIEAGARVHRSIVGPGATVGAGAELLDHTVVGAGVEVEAGSRLTGERFPADS